MFMGVVLTILNVHGRKNTYSKERASEYFNHLSVSIEYCRPLSVQAAIYQS